MSGRRILVVDDEPSVRNTIRMVLNYHGYTVEIAGDGEAALSLLQQEPFHLVVTDYFMPGMKGYQLASQIKRQFPSLPVIMVTAYPDEVLPGGKLPGHLDHLILKPFPVSELVEAVSKLLSCCRSDEWPPSRTDDGNGPVLDG